MLRWRAAEVLFSFFLGGNASQKRLELVLKLFHIYLHLASMAQLDTPESMFNDSDTLVTHLSLSLEPKGGRIWRAGLTLCYLRSGFFVKPLLVSLEATRLVFLPAVLDPSSLEAF